MSKTKVLFVEDNASIRRLWDAQVKKLFGDEERPETLFAATVEEALVHFRTNYDIEIVVMDGNLASGNTLGLVREFRSKGFKKPIITVSSEPTLRREMLEAGCSMECERKDRVVDMVKTLLEFDPQATSVSQALRAREGVDGPTIP